MLETKLSQCSTTSMHEKVLEPGTDEHLRAVAEIFGVGHHTVTRLGLQQAVVGAALQIIMQPIAGSEHEAVRMLAYDAVAAYCKLPEGYSRR